MRKHDVRKWLHAILDLLPLFIIPVFMVYSHRHIIDTYSVTAQEDVLVEHTYYINQLVSNGKPNNNSTTGYSTDIGYIFYDEPYVYNQGAVGAALDASEGNVVYEQGNTTIVSDHLFYVTFCNSITTNAELYDSSFSIYFTDGDAEDWTDTAEFEPYYKLPSMTERYKKFNYILTGGNNTAGTMDYYQIVWYFYLDEGTDCFLHNVQMFDLTAIFGAGNEPTLADCEDIFTLDYYEYGTTYEYTVSGIETQTTVYDNTDIGSQFIYALYNPIHDYFNFNNVGTFNTMYQWVEVNIFNGTAPLSVFIVWNIVLYEFIMDILFLFYAVFMFIVDFAENCLDRAFSKSCPGGR